MSVLYITAVPIGNPDDITFRAVRILKESDILYCESEKECFALLSQLSIQRSVKLLNEHNEEAAISEALNYLKQGKSVCLISDCGTPCFEDPGKRLVETVHKAGIKVSPVPGPSSFAALLSVSGCSLKSFEYAGLLPRKSEERVQEIKRIASSKIPVLICDTPYRLAKTVQECAQIIGKTRTAVIGFNLTASDEQIIRAPLEKIAAQFAGKKGEFLLLVEPRVKKQKSFRNHFNKRKLRPAQKP